MKFSVGISNFLEEISPLSHSIVLLYFFALIPEKGFLISPGYSLELYIQMGISGRECSSVVERVLSMHEAPGSFPCTSSFLKWVSLSFSPLPFTSLLFIKWEDKGRTEDEMVGWHHHSRGICLSKFQYLVSDWEAWLVAVFGIAKSWTRLSD